MWKSQAGRFGLTSAFRTSKEKCCLPAVAFKLCARKKGKNIFQNLFFFFALNCFSGWFSRVKLLFMALPKMCSHRPKVQQPHQKHELFSGTAYSLWVTLRLCVSMSWSQTGTIWEGERDRDICLSICRVLIYTVCPFSILFQV